MPDDPRRTAEPTPPAELDAQAEPTAEDIQHAKVIADKDGSALLAAMLHALPDEGM